MEMWASRKLPFSICGITKFYGYDFQGSVEKRLTKRSRTKIPHWLSELLQTHSLCGAELFWQAYPPETNFDGRSYITFADPDRIVLESVELTPGREILPLGFVCVATDDDGIGDPYFIALDQEDPPVYQVHHDNDEDEHQIGPHQARLVARHLSEFLNMLVPTGSTG